MTGSTKTMRKTGFCTAPTCCQMNSMQITPIRSSAVSARARQREAWPEDNSVNATCSAPSASRPQLPPRMSTSKPLKSQGTAVANTTVASVISQMASSRWTRGFSQDGCGSSCVASAFTKQPLPRLFWLRRSDRCGTAHRAVTEVVVVQERLRVHLRAVRRLKVLHVQRESMRMQHLVVSQDRRVPDHVDAVVLRLDDRVLDGGAGSARIPEHESEPVTAIVQAVGAYQGVGRATHHDAISGQSLQFVVIDDGAAGVLRNDAHGGSPAHVIATDDATGAHQVHIRFPGIDEVVTLYQHRNVSGHDPDAVPREFVVVDVDGLVVRIGRAAHRPDARVLVAGEFVAGDDRVASRGGKTDPDPIADEAIALEQRVARVLGDLHPDIARVGGRARQVEMDRAHQNRRAGAAGDRDPFDRGVRPGYIQHRPGAQRLRI